MIPELAFHCQVRRKRAFSGALQSCFIDVPGDILVVTEGAAGSDRDAREVVDRPAPLGDVAIERTGREHGGRLPVENGPAPGCSRVVLEAAGLPIGQIRFEEIGDEAWIDYSLDSIVRGRGWGTRLVALGMDLLRSNKPVHFCAEVKPNNKVSRSIFLRLGFVEKEDRGKVFYYDNLKSSKLAERLHS